MRASAKRSASAHQCVGTVDGKVFSFVRMAGLTTSLVALAALPAAGQTATATFKNADGKEVGTARLTQAATGGVLISLSVSGLPTGDRAFHIHAVGKCEPPFTSAEGHFNPGNKKHGMMALEGHHAGDMPNLHIPASGTLAVDVVNEAITLDKGNGNPAADVRGLSFIIHAGKDDYKTDPTGDAGGRIACGIIE